jgi:hypothetical protein
MTRRPKRPDPDAGLGFIDDQDEASAVAASGPQDGNMPAKRRRGDIHDVIGSRLTSRYSILEACGLIPIGAKPTVDGALIQFPDYAFQAGVEAVGRGDAVGEGRGSYADLRARPGRRRRRRRRQSGRLRWRGCARLEGAYTSQAHGGLPVPRR